MEIGLRLGPNPLIERRGGRPATSFHARRPHLISTLHNMDGARQVLGNRKPGFLLHNYFKLSYGRPAQINIPIKFRL